jgi:hypothetical protein
MVDDEAGRQGAPGRQQEAIKLSAQGWLDLPHTHTYIWTNSRSIQTAPKLLVHNNNLCVYFLPTTRGVGWQKCFACALPLPVLWVVMWVCSLRGLKIIFPYATGNRNFSLLEGSIGCKEAKLINESLHSGLSLRGGFIDGTMNVALHDVIECFIDWIISSASKQPTSQMQRGISPAFVLMKEIYSLFWQQCQI